MKRVVVVDHDVDIFDDRQVTWAIATRCQPDRDITIVTHARGSDLDPSTAQDGYSAKWGVDATAKPSLAGLHPAPPRAAGDLATRQLEGLRTGRPRPQGSPKDVTGISRPVSMPWPSGGPRPRPSSGKTARSPGEPSSGEREAWRDRSAPRSHRGDTIALIVGNGWGFAAALWGGLKLGVTIAPLNPLLSAGERGRVLEHLRPSAVLEEVPADEAEWPSADAGAPRAHPLHLRKHGPAQGRRALPRRAWRRQRIVGGPRDAIDPGRCGAGRAPLAHSFGLNGALLAPSSRAPRWRSRSASSPRRRSTPSRDTASPCSRPWPPCSRRCWKSPRCPRPPAPASGCPCPGPRPARGSSPRRGGDARGENPPRLRDDRALPPDLVSGRRGGGLAGRHRARGAGRRAARGGRRGEACGAGEVGELWIRSPAAMDGYLRAEQETHAVMRDGWFRTGTSRGSRPPASSPSWGGRRT